MEVPIKFVKDKRNRAPHLSTWADGWRHLKAIILLKPASLYPIILALLLSAFAVYRISFAATFLLLELSYILSLSLVTLKLFQSVLEKQSNVVSRFLNRFEIVPMVMLASFFVILSIIVMPDARLGTKLFLVSSLGILFMWLFLIETIKTYLVNRLPDL